MDDTLHSDSWIDEVFEKILEKLKFDVDVGDCGLLSPDIMDNDFDDLKDIIKKPD